MSRLLTLLRPKGGPLFYDTFTDANGTSLAAHAPDKDRVGGGWAINEGAIAIQSNLAQSSGGAWNSAMADVGTADVSISVKVIRGSADGVGLLLRRDTSSRYWLAEINASAIRLLERDSTTTVRASAAVSTTVGPQYTLHAAVAGETMSVSIPALAVTASYGSASAYKTRTQHGLFGFGANHKWDDFEVNA